MRSRIKELDNLKTGGNTAFSSGDYAEAIRLYTAAIEFDPTLVDLLPTLYTNRATAKSKLGQHEAAVADCGLALQSNPRHLKALLRRAACRMEMEAYQQAIDDFSAAQDIEPNDRSIGQSLRSAKMELKKSLRKDLYKLIGVTKQASELEIKKAYKKMALTWHPDRHSAGSEAEREEAEKRFKEIGEAFEILSDPIKKQKYDEGMDVEDINGGGGGRGHSHHGIDPMDIFAHMGGMGGFDSGGMPHGYPRRGGR
jgi:DnaJ family protein C protein 7